MAEILQGPGQEGKEPVPRCFHLHWVGTVSGGCRFLEGPGPSHRVVGPWAAVKGPARCTLVCLCPLPTCRVEGGPKGWDGGAEPYPGQRG